MFEDMVEVADEALHVWREVIEFYQTAESADGVQFNRTANIPGISHNIDWFDIRIQGCLNLAKSLKAKKILDEAPIPSIFLNELEASVDSLKVNISNIKTALQLVESNSIASLDPSNWIIVVTGTNQNINFASHLQTLVPLIDDCLIKFYRLSSIIGSEKFDVFTDALIEFSDKAKDIRNKTKFIRATNTKIENIFKKLKTTDSTATEYLVSVKSALDKITALQEKSSASSDEIESLKETASGIVEEARELEKEVNEYSTTFESFQKKLDEKEETYETQRKNADSLFEEFEDKRDKVTEIINQSEDMLKGATNAGLAGTFKTTLTELDKKLKSAQTGFYWSIVFLLITVIPLVYYLYNIGMQTNIDPTNLKINTDGFWTQLLASLQTSKFSPLSTIALASLMAPAIWVAKFTANRYHQLFQLREHYQFKYSLAISVDGFKKQAPKYEEEIAAETFNNLLFNPADKLSGIKKSDSMPNPILNKIFDKFGINGKGEET